MNNTEINTRDLVYFLDEVLKNLYNNNSISDYNIKLLCYILYNHWLYEVDDKNIESALLTILRNIDEETAIISQIQTQPKEKNSTIHKKEFNKDYDNKQLFTKIKNNSLINKSRLIEKNF